MEVTDGRVIVMQIVDVQLTVPKRIVLYLARESPADAPEEVNQTIDHLVAEAARLINEDESETAPMGVARALHLPTASATSAAATPRHREKVGNPTATSVGILGLTIDGALLRLFWSDILTPNLL